MGQMTGSNSVQKQLASNVWDEFGKNEHEEKFDDQNIQAFFIDLDCQFLMVPRNLVRDALIFRLINISKPIVTLLTWLSERPGSNEYNQTSDEEHPTEEEKEEEQAAGDDDE